MSLSHEIFMYFQFRGLRSASHSIVVSRRWVRMGLANFGASAM
jgi:hypothetical protein